MSPFGASRSTANPARGGAVSLLLRVLYLMTVALAGALSLLVNFAAAGHIDGAAAGGSLDLA
jgi:hypothetical protein